MPQKIETILRQTSIRTLRKSIRQNDMHSFSPIQTSDKLLSCRGPFAFGKLSTTTNRPRQCPCNFTSIMKYLQMGQDKLTLRQSFASFMMDMSLSTRQVRFLPSQTILHSVADNIMQRDLTLRTPGSEKSDTQSIRLVDSRGKRAPNSKISIYSQKYTVGPSQTQREQNRIIRTQNPTTPNLYTTAPLHPNIRTSIQSARREDHHSALSASHEKNQQSTTTLPSSNKDDNSMVNSSAIGSLKDYLQSVRAHYQAKIKQIIDENARTINELRNLLMHQQHRIAEKEELINRILNNQQFRSPPKRNTINDSPNKIVARFLNPNAGLECLNNKIKDLEKTVKVITDHCMESEEMVKNKIEAVEKGLIRYLSDRVTKCWFRMSQFSDKLEKRCSDLDSKIANKQSEFLKSEPASKFSPLKRSSFHAQMMEFQQCLAGFAAKQYRYQNKQVQNLQHLLTIIKEKVDSLEKLGQLRSSRRLDNGYFFEDDDEFFYPCSQRKVYQPNDDYEHFQAESQEESLDPTKQNIRDNSLPTNKPRKH